MGGGVGRLRGRGVAFLSRRVARLGLDCLVLVHLGDVVAAAVSSRGTFTLAAEGR